MHITVIVSEVGLLKEIIDISLILWQKNPELAKWNPDFVTASRYYSPL